MKIKFKIHTLWIIVIALLFITCNKDENQARKSIEGDWDITAITSTYGDFSGNGFDSDTTITETGELGTFMFGDDSVLFNFTRNDTLNVGSSTWSIKSEKVNSGFTRVTDFTLTIDNTFVFNVEFEDGTKNSEKKANKATFIETPTSGYGVLIEMSLEKN